MANSKRQVTEITKKEDIEFLVNMSQDVTTSLMMECFGEFGGKSRFKSYDSIAIPPGSYGPEGKKNKNTFYTTVGVWVFNKFFIEKDLFNLFKYVEKTVDKKNFKKLNQTLSYALLEDDIEVDVLKRFLMKTQKLMPFVTILSPSQTLKMLVCTKDIEKKKKELLKKYDKEIKAGDILIATKIEKELLDYSKELLKDDPSLDLYDSGARASFGNNFKNLYVMKGVVKNPDPDKGYEIATSNYMSGISREDYHIFANSLAAGPYARGKKTEIGGYWEKLFLAAFQHVILMKEGSDCGTKRYIELDTNQQDIKDYIYSYVIENGGLTEITSKNMDKYKGKKIKIRFSSMCESKNGYCHKCAGNFWNRMGISNIGMIMPVIPAKLKTLSMKSFHSSVMELVEIDALKAFGLK